MATELTEYIDAHVAAAWERRAFGAEVMTTMGPIVSPGAVYDRRPITEWVHPDDYAARRADWVRSQL